MSERIDPKHWNPFDTLHNIHALHANIINSLLSFLFIVLDEKLRLKANMQKTKVELTSYHYSIMYETVIELKLYEARDKEDTITCFLSYLHITLFLMLPWCKQRYTAKI